MVKHLEAGEKVSYHAMLIFMNNKSFNDKVWPKNMKIIFILTYPKKLNFDDKIK